MHERCGAAPRAGRGDALPLRVLVDALSANTGGGRTYAQAQLDELARRDDLELTVYAAGELAQQLTRIARLNVISEARRGTLRRLVWEQTTIPRRARSFDVLYMLGNFAVVLSRRPQVVALQNAIHFGPQAREVRRLSRSPIYRARVAAEASLARRSVRHASACLVVSRSLAAAIAADLGQRDKLHAVPSAPPCQDGAWKKRSHPPPAGRPTAHYALSIAHDYPHKDWDGLVEAFARHADLPRLVLVGKPRSMRRMRRLMQWLVSAGLADRVTFCGEVRDRATLETLYADATCFVAHSRLESFGFTACEAMCHELPLAASDIPAHREICGGAATYYAPDDPESLAAAVRTVLRRNGLARVRAPVFERTWTQNANDVADILRLAVERGKPGPARPVVPT